VRPARAGLCQAANVVKPCMLCCCCWKGRSHVAGSLLLFGTQSPTRLWLHQAISRLMVVATSCAHRSQQCTVVASIKAWLSYLLAAAADLRCQSGSTCTCAAVAVFVAESFLCTLYVCILFLCMSVLYVDFRASLCICWCLSPCVCSGPERMCGVTSPA
jgi:hypothetical protein